MTDTGFGQIFPAGESDDAYAPYFTGQSHLAPLTDGSVRDLSEPPSGGIDHGNCCVIVTGAPASGKSTLTHRLAEHLEHSAWLNGDQIHGLIVGGRVWALGDPKDEADRQTHLGNQNLVALARNCARAGFTPIIDWIIPDADQLAEFAGGLLPLPLCSSCWIPGMQRAARETCSAMIASLSTGTTFSSVA